MKHIDSKTCGQCKHFIGAGDWNLCCNLREILCYKETSGCDLFEEIQKYKESEEWLIHQLNFYQNEEKHHGPIPPMAWDEVCYFGDYLINNYRYTMDNLKEQWPVLFSN